MGLLTALIGYGLYQIVKNQNKGIQLGGIAVAAWLSVMAGALATSFQLWLSGTSPAEIVFPAMLSVHTLIGIGEALITVAAFGFIRQVRPDLVQPKETALKTNYGWVTVGGIISLAVVLISPFASADPDGLERVAEDLGFLSQAQDNPFNILADYSIPFLGETGLSTIIAGIIGIVIVGLIAFFIGKAIKKPSTAEEHTS
jgi:cobalt/nickel transport system permease protein